MSYFGLALLLAPIYGTGIVALVTGGLCLTAYYATKYLLPDRVVYQYVLSAVTGVFMALFSYQLHGMFQMHFFAFVGAALLICYKDWKLQIPLVLVTLTYHSLFTYLQAAGVEGVYFAQPHQLLLPQLVFNVSSAMIIFTICGLWAYTFGKTREKYLRQTYELGRLQNEGKQQEAIDFERLRAHAEAVKFHALIEATLESVADGILVTDPDWNIVLCNKKGAALWGLPEDQIDLNDQCQFLNSISDRVLDSTAFWQSVTLTLMQPDAESHDILEFKDGTILERFSRPLMIEGHFESRVWNFRDITDHRRAKELLEQQNRELVKANLELDRFVYSASHELRAPLTSVLGLVSIARMAEEDESKINILDMMQKSIERLDIFIKDIVNYSANSRLEIIHDKIDFEELIFGSIEQLRFMPEMGKIGIFTEFHGEADFYSDTRRIAVLVNNLLSNAIKYQDSDRENPYVHVTVRMTNAAVEIAISDNGLGIPQAYQSKIFNMFYRATQKKTGTGLGLYIVKEILERLHGEIRVESEVGMGSTFYLTIPNGPLSLSSVEDNVIQMEPLPVN